MVGTLLAYIWARYLCAQPSIWQPRSTSGQYQPVPDKALLEDFTFYALLGVIIGGRLGSIILYNPDKYFADPIKIFYIWEGGMAFHGGFIGVCLAVIYTSYRYKVSLWRLADIVACSCPIALGLVRLANFANQELYGRITDVPWAFIFDTDPFAVPRHPSQLYESFLEGAMIFLILMLLTHKAKALTRPGLCAGCFIFLYGLFRIAVENLREPDASLIGPLTRGMAYSLPMIIAGLGLIIYALHRPIAGTLTQPRDPP